MIASAVVAGTGGAAIAALAMRPLADRLLASNPDRLRITPEPPPAMTGDHPGLLRPLIFALESRGFHIVGSTVERWPLGLREGRSLVMLSQDRRISAGILIHFAFLKVGSFALAEVPGKPFWVLTSVLASGRQVRTNSNPSSPVTEEPDVVYGGANGDDAGAVIVAHETAISRTGESASTFADLDASIRAAREFLRSPFMRARLAEGARAATGTWLLRSLRLAALTAGVALVARYSF